MKNKINFMINQFLHQQGHTNTLKILTKDQKTNFSPIKIFKSVSDLKENFPNKLNLLIKRYEILKEINDENYNKAFDELNHIDKNLSVDLLCKIVYKKKVDLKNEEFLLLEVINQVFNCVEILLLDFIDVEKLRKISLNK